MKTILSTFSFIFLLSLISVSCTKEDDIQNPIVTDPSTQLVQAEIDGLIYMREEEKLARDVYIHFFNLYGSQNFTNISNSEQMHMDRILTLLTTYQITDPASTEMGVFNDARLQILYNDLIAKGEKSLLDAQIVGETIEDLDIYDLDNYMTSTTRPDILAAYDFLACGSRNHMRAFDSQVVKLGSTYQPQYITSEKFNAIINGAHEQCQ